MNTDAVVAINNVSLCLLIGFLCWLFQHWWPILLLAFWSQKEFVNLKKEDK
jgi:hypothetical protein